MSGFSGVSLVAFTLIIISVFFSISSAQLTVRTISDLSLNITLQPGEKKVFRYDPEVRTVALLFNVTTNRAFYSGDRGASMTCFDITEAVYESSWTTFEQPSLCGSPLMNQYDPWWYLTLSLADDSETNETFTIQIYPIQHSVIEPGVKYATPIASAGRPNATKQYYAVTIPASYGYMGYYVNTDSRYITAMDGGRVRSTIHSSVYNQYEKTPTSYMNGINYRWGVLHDGGNTDWVYYFTYEIPFNFTFTGINESDIPTYVPGTEYPIAGDNSGHPFRLATSSEYRQLKFNMVDYSQPIAFCDTEIDALPHGIFVKAEERVLCWLHSTSTPSSFNLTLIPPVTLIPNQPLNITCPATSAFGTLIFTYFLFKVDAVPGKRYYSIAPLELQFEKSDPNSLYSTKNRYSSFDDEEDTTNTKYSMYNCWNRNATVLFRWLDPVEITGEGDHIMTVTDDVTFFEIPSQVAPYSLYSSGIGEMTDINTGQPITSAPFVFDATIPRRIMASTYTFANPINVQLNFTMQEVDLEENTMGQYSLNGVDLLQIHVKNTSSSASIVGFRVIIQSNGALSGFMRGKIFPTGLNIYVPALNTPKILYFTVPNEEIHLNFRKNNPTSPQRVSFNVTVEYYRDHDFQEIVQFNQPITNLVPGTIQPFKISPSNPTKSTGILGAVLANNGSIQVINSENPTKGPGDFYGMTSKYTTIIPVVRFNTEGSDTGTWYFFALPAATNFSMTFSNVNLASGTICDHPDGISAGICNLGQLPRPSVQPSSSSSSNNSGSNNETAGDSSSNVDVTSTITNTGSLPDDDDDNNSSATRHLVTISIGWAILLMISVMF